MRLKRYDVITFTLNGKEHRGSALRYDPASGVIVAKVFGRTFRWEGGPPGEYLDSKDNLVPGKIGCGDSLWLVPFTAITNVESSRPYERKVVSPTA